MKFIPDIPVRLTAYARSDYAILLSEDESYYLPGSDVARVVSLIDGRRSADSIVRRLKGIVTEQRTRQVLERLRSQGMICHTMSGVGPGLSYLCQDAGVKPADARRALQETTVSIDSDDVDDADQLTLALCGLGVRVGGEGNFTVAIAPDLLAPRLSELNMRLQAKRQPWLLIKPGGDQPTIGPLFVPGRTGCWSCLAHRLKENRWLETRMFGHAYTSTGPTRVFRPIGTTPLAILLLAANQVMKWVLNPDENPLAGKIWRLSATEAGTSTHILTRRPDCTVCGERPSRRQVRAVLTRRRIVCFSGGGYRTALPDETLKRLQHLVSPITGILSSLDRYGADGSSYLYGGTHVLPLPGSIECRILGRPGAASGKGITEAEAKAGCLAEAVERYSAVFQGTEPRLRGRVADLPGKSLTPAELVQFSKSQYAARAKWNPAHSAFQRIPEPFDATEAIEWSKTTSLTTGEAVYVPTAYCYLQYNDPRCKEFCYASSNGCAAGNVREEAVLQGLLELIERDAIALWWYNRVKRPGVDVDSFRDPCLSRIADRLRQQGRSLTVLDLTTDLNVATFAAVSASPQGRRPLFGFGAHLDARVALTRALTELEQVLSTAPAAGVPQKVAFTESMRDYRRWLRFASLKNQPYLLPSRECRQSKHYNVPVHDDLLGCLDILLARCSRAGLHVLLLDLTRDDIGFPVVRVLVPGLRHCWAQFGPGRLYDVPLSLGWLLRRRSESELNQFPFFL
jgi:ribosomal protein S12 methylthiotransferase accessory factor